MCNKWHLLQFSIDSNNQTGDNEVVSETLIIPHIKKEEYIYAEKYCLVNISIHYLTLFYLFWCDFYLEKNCELT